MYQTKEEIIYRIVSGEQSINIGGTSYTIKTPSNELRLASEDLARQTIIKNRFDQSWMSDNECLRILVANGICSADIDNNIKEIDKTIDDLKVGLFTSLFIPDIHREKRKQLSMVKKKKMEMVSARASLEHLTLKGYAAMIKSQYLIFNTAYHKDGSRVWTDWDSVDVFLLEKMFYKVLENSIDVMKIREISRTEPWRGYWNIKKMDVFGGSVFNYSDEQKSLLLFSRMYDSAYEHPECPSEDVIKDDDIFDGWMISESRKREKEKMTAALDKNLNKNNKIKDSGEVFLVAKSEEDRKRVEAMNDTAGSIIKAQRQALLKKKGTARDINFTDVKLGIQQQANEQFKKGS